MKRFVFVGLMLAASAACAGQDDDAQWRLMDARNARKADIAYWINGYDGAELSAGKFACAPFKAPADAKSEEEVKRVMAEAEAWRACHNAFVANLNAQAPVGSRIPADVEALMTDAEFEQAKGHLAMIYRNLSARARQEAADMKRDYVAWNATLSEPVAKHIYETNQLQAQRDQQSRKDPFPAARPSPQPGAGPIRH